MERTEFIRYIKSDSQCIPVVLVLCWSAVVWLLQDNAIHNSEMNLSKMQTLVAAMQMQTSALQKNVQTIPALKQQMEQMNI